MIDIDIILLARLKGTVAKVSPSVVCCPSRSRISKTKQDRPIVTAEHYSEVGTADFVAVVRSTPDAPWDIF